MVVNKIDRPDQRIHEVIDEVLELLLDLDATPEQLDSPMLFCSARQGVASYSPDVPGTDLKPLFDTILSYIPAPEADLDQPFQMLVSAIDYNEFVGRIAIGRVERGVLKQNQEIAVCNYHDPDAPAKKAKAVSMYEFQGLGKQPITEATAGNIIAMSGIGDITIGDTICAPECVEPLPVCEDFRPHHGDDLLRQRLPLCRPRGQVRHLPPAAGPPVPGDPEGRVPAGDGDRRRHRRLQRGGPGRDEPVHPYRDHAPGGL